MQRFLYVERKLIAIAEKEKVIYIVTDHLNAPQLIMDSTGKAIWSASYATYGKATITGNYQLNIRADGQYQDDETGLYYNWYRYYSPELGRYITSDPLGLQAGMNTYIYVNGNPINATDPMGLDATGVTVGISGELIYPYIGIAGTVSGSVGRYSNTQGNAKWSGSATYGGFIRVGNYIIQYPKPQNTSEPSLHQPNGLSASLGVNVGAFHSNAQCVEDTLGYSDNYGVSPLLIPVQYQQTVSGNINTSSIYFTPGIGGTIYNSYPTYTIPIGGGK